MFAAMCRETPYPRRQNGTLPRTFQVQIWVLPPMPSYSPPVLNWPPPANIAVRPPVARAAKPCSSGTVVRPVVFAHHLRIRQ